MSAAFDFNHDFFTAKGVGPFQWRSTHTLSCDISERCRLLGLPYHSILWSNVACCWATQSENKHPGFSRVSACPDSPLSPSLHLLTGMIHIWSDSTLYYNNVPLVYGKDPCPLELFTSSSARLHCLPFTFPALVFIRERSHCSPQAAGCLGRDLHLWRLQAMAPSTPALSSCLESSHL